MGRFENDSIFWVEVDKISPNPYQPRRDFDEEQLEDLADSIRQYGVLQPLTVTRNEKEKDSGGIEVQYELIAGERRHRAAKMAGLSQVPVIIRSGKETGKMKLELAIIENLQREDLNPIERAQAFKRLNEEFDFTHKEIAEKIGKSRVYVSNSIRLLKLPDEMQKALMSGKITEGHARPLMMLRDNPEQQQTVFKEILHKGMTVRESEEVARSIAKDKARKKKSEPDPETEKFEEELSDSLGTRVKIKRKNDKEGGKVIIDFFSDDDLETILELVSAGKGGEAEDMMERYIEKKKEEQEAEEESEEDTQQEEAKEKTASESPTPGPNHVSSEIEEAQKSLASQQPEETAADMDAGDAGKESTDAGEESESEADINEKQQEKIAEIVAAHFGGEEGDSPAEEDGLDIPDDTQTPDSPEGSDTVGDSDEVESSDDLEDINEDDLPGELKEEIADDGVSEESEEALAEVGAEEGTSKEDLSDDKEEEDTDDEEDLYSVNNFSV